MAIFRRHQRIAGDVHAELSMGWVDPRVGLGRVGLATSRHTTDYSLASPLTNVVTGRRSKVTDPRPWKAAVSDDVMEVMPISIN